MIKLFSKLNKSKNDNNNITVGTSSKRVVDILTLKFFDEDGNEYILGDLLSGILSNKSDIATLRKEYEAKIEDLEYKLKMMSYTDELLGLKQASVEVDVKKMLKTKKKEVDL